MCNKKANTANSVRLLCGLLTQFVNLSRFKAGLGAWRKPPAGKSCCCWRRRCRLPSWKSCNSFDSFRHSNCPLTSHNLQTKYRQDLIKLNVCLTVIDENFTITPYFHLSWQMLKINYHMGHVQRRTEVRVNHLD